MPRRSTSTPRRRASCTSRTCAPRSASACRGCGGGRCTRAWPRSSRLLPRWCGSSPRAGARSRSASASWSASGVEVRRAGREAIAHDTRERKRYGVDTAPWQEVVRARAAEHGFGARELGALVRGPAREPERPDAQLVSDELAGAAGLTERQNTFARREAVMAWAAAHGQGAPAAVVERAAAEFLRARTCTAHATRARCASRRAISLPTRKRSSEAHRHAAAKVVGGCRVALSTRSSLLRPSRPRPSRQP